MSLAALRKPPAPLQPRAAECVRLEVAMPGRPVLPGGILLVDVEADELYVKLRRDWEEVAGDEAEAFEPLEDQLRRTARDMGARRFLGYLEDTLSNLVRVTDRESMWVANFPARLERLYRECVGAPVLPYRTHLPLTTLEAAAGGLGREMQVEPDGWIEVPPGVRLREGMFVARVTGRSMEPAIPDGSLCVFDANSVKGSRSNKLLLIQKFGTSDFDAQFTVKKYVSEKVYLDTGNPSDFSGDVEWRHSKVRLYPLNPEFEAWDLEPDQFAVIGEFVAVLPETAD